METLSLLKRAHAAGLTLTPEGEKLVVRGPKRAEPVVRLLAAHKAAVVAALTAAGEPGVQSTTAHIAIEFAPDLADMAPAYWRDLYEERCAIRQFEAGYPKAIAERLAWGETIEAWCDRHPPLSETRVCAGCGKPLGHDVLDLPDRVRVHFEFEREFGCLIASGFARKRRAVAALAALGLRPPAGWRPPDASPRSGRQEARSRAASGYGWTAKSPDPASGDRCSRPGESGIMNCACLWCGRPFEPRSNGGKRQRFCAEPCRRAFAKAALAWTVEAVASGALVREELWSASPATRRSILEGEPGNGVVE